MNTNQKFLTISWLALGAAIIVPPVGIILGIVAVVKSKQLPNRPGNKALAFSSIGVGAMMSLMFGSMLFSFLMYSAQARQVDFENQRMNDEIMRMREQALQEQFQLEQQAQKAVLEAEKALMEAEQAQRALNQIAPPNID